VYNYIFNSYTIQRSAHSLPADGDFTRYLYGVFVNGFHELDFPKYSKLILDSSGNLDIKDVTFERSYRQLLEPYLRKAENSLEENTGRVFSSEELVQGYLQYYYYMVKLGRSKKALNKISRSKIKLEFRNDLSEKKIISMEEYLKRICISTL